MAGMENKHTGRDGDHVQNAYVPSASLVETHGEAVALRDPLLRVDDKGWVPWLSPDQAANPVPVAIECKSAPLIPEVGHIPEHEVAV